MRNLSYRQRRVGSEVRTQLASVLPAIVQWQETLKGYVMTLLEVRMSPDLRLATVLLAPPFPGCPLSKEEITTHLTDLVPQIRRKLAAATTLRFVPDLRFHFEKEENAALANLLQVLRSESP